MGKGKSTFWADFKKFITRGNVLDMAVGVVVGGAFGKITTGLVNYIINPFVGLFLKSGSLDGVKTVITPAVTNAEGVVTTPEVAILWGAWLQTIIDFLIIALCIFTVLRVIMKVRNTLNEKEIKAAEEKAAKEKAEAEAAKAAADAAATKKEAEEQKLKADVARQAELLEKLCNIMESKKYTNTFKKNGILADSIFCFCNGFE